MLQLTPHQQMLSTLLMLLLGLIMMTYLLMGKQYYFREDEKANLRRVVHLLVLTMITALVYSATVFGASIAALFGG